MESSSEFFNMYVEKVLTEVSELTKTKLLLQTQIAWNEKTIQEMSVLQNKLQESVNDLSEKLRASLLEKKSPKSKDTLKVSSAGITDTSPSMNGDTF